MSKVWEVTLREVVIKTYRVIANTREDAIEAAKSEDGVVIDHEGEDQIVIAVDEGE